MICRDMEEFAAAVVDGAATGVIAEEAFTQRGVERLMEALTSQPPWSDLPLTVLTNSGVYQTPGRRFLSKLAEAGNITLLERPSRVVTMVTIVQAAVRARKRQYQFREYLQQYDRYQEQVRQTQKLESLGVLAGGIAHDFNNILTGILGNASLATEILPPSHLARRLLEDVVTASERAAGLTRQMLAYAGKGELVFGTVNLSTVVNNLMDFFRASVPKRIEFSLQLASDLPAIEADTSQLEQVVMNLVINAAEAVPEGRPGKVAVTTEMRELDHGGVAKYFAENPPEPGTYIALEVSDDGIGMSEETRAKIFDPFFTTKFLGRGLGLAAVQGIIRGHNGALAVDSTPGKGTKFTVLFPASRRVLPRTNGDDDQTPAQHSTILVVDDEEIVRRTATLLLEQMGHAVLCAENGKAAVETFRSLRGQVDAVLLDMTMPFMDGEETFRELKAIRPDAKIILSSGYNEAEAVRRFAGHGLTGFIQKPYTKTRLEQKIKHALESRNMQPGAAAPFKV
ncbi:MAG: response regulator [Acidobacteriia bacterium]|nr:response regulator [Terriglobia bacterium]